ncbi:hypothetical protein OL239_17910 [Arthrobacter sp. ATA002]|uniref:hypothetical protein n=1 Tax=Arthrobacter sp. ATA002 TaxID=2991715 RepID=UPI0022A75CD4|nr:hypothetical protein [Arthrobacter sp. ATA002]WAP51619.1 hypothetical protein OL239_17910 [Arthrobacter sp. ATA002]
MDNSETAPSLAQLRSRQTDLVAALAVETSSSRLAALSTELEAVLEKIQQSGQQTPRPQEA